jgi:hypothetical protein
MKLVSLDDDRRPRDRTDLVELSKVADDASGRAPRWRFG